MPVIGYAVNNGHLSFIYKLGQNDFLRTIADAVHAAHPFHLVSGFQRFCYAFLLCHIGNEEFEELCRQEGLRTEDFDQSDIDEIQRRLDRY